MVSQRAMVLEGYSSMSLIRPNDAKLAGEWRKRAVRGESFTSHNFDWL